MARVFISSVMEGFSPFRQAVAEIAESLGHEAVMAERFGPRSTSPREACLGEVRSSDWYVLILGERYGWTGPSGTSPTHHEYEEARKHGKKILVLLQKGVKPEAKQQAFIDEVGRYDTGHFRASFTSVTDIAPVAAKGLHRLQTELSVESTSISSEDRLAELEEFDDEDSRRPIARLVVLPVHAGPLFDVSSFGNSSFNRRITQLGRYGEGSIFSEDHGCSTEDGREHVRIVQRDSEGAATDVCVHLDGAIQIALSLDQRSDGYDTPFFHLSSMVISESRTRDCVTKALKFAASFFADLAERAPNAYMVRVCLANLSGKKFGELPSERSGGISMAFTTIEDPLWVPSRATRQSLAGLHEAHELAASLTTHIARVFKAAKAYESRK